MDYAEEATFYRAALLLGLIRGPQVVAWADALLAADASPPGALVEVSSTPPDDLTQLRYHLWSIGGDTESSAAVRALVGLVHRDLAGGRRSFDDTMRVSKQLRTSVAVGATLNEHLKTLGVDVAVSAPGSMERREAEARVRAWLAEYGVEPASLEP